MACRENLNSIEGQTDSTHYIHINLNNKMRSMFYYITTIEGLKREASYMNIEGQGIYIVTTISVL